MKDHTFNPREGRRSTHHQRSLFNPRSAQIAHQPPQLKSTKKHTECHTEFNPAEGYKSEDIPMLQDYVTTYNRLQASTNPREQKRLEYKLDRLGRSIEDRGYRIKDFAAIDPPPSSTTKISRMGPFFTYLEPKHTSIEAEVMKMINERYRLSQDIRINKPEPVGLVGIDESRKLLFKQLQDTSRLIGFFQWSSDDRHPDNFDTSCSEDYKF